MLGSPRSSASKGRTMSRQCAQEAHRFLEALDPDAREWCIRTFDDVVLPDGTKRKDPSLTRNFTGTLSEHFDSLCPLNDRGAGVFVVINEGGHTKGEITRVRAGFADTDGAPLEPIVSALAPHIVVESSPGNWHAYYLTADGFPLDKFSPVQEAIAEKFGTDKNVKDLPRVMRLPGFFHNKGDPFRTRITHLDTERPNYTRAEIVAGLGLTLDKPAPAPSVGAVPVSGLSGPVPAWAKAGGGVGSIIDAAAPTRQHTLEEVESALAYIDPNCDRATWFKVLCGLVHEFEEEAFDLAHRWSRGDLWRGAA